MNGKKAKLIRKKAKELQVEWINTLLPESDYVTIDTVDQALPEQQYYLKGGSLRHSFMSNKFVQKRLKKNINLTYEELESELQKSYEVNVV
tara:strand:- start:554 stop:826 length:273 start_codon:yes stop_codon:yes gene_type:complete